MVAPDLQCRFERIEDLYTGAIEIPFVACHDRETVPSSRCSDIAVFEGHSTPRLMERVLLFSPYMSNGDVEPVNSTVQGIHEPGEPCLKKLALPSLLCANPSTPIAR